jgi:hypothetical protein
VIEVRSKAEAGSFERFRTALSSHVPTATLKPGAVAVEYTTIDGRRMKFAFPGTRVLNGKKVDLTKTRLFEGPFLHAEVGSEKLTMTYKGTERILDFKNLTITE